jgi:hypothetical protein
MKRINPPPKALLTAKALHSKRVERIPLLASIAAFLAKPKAPTT